MASTFDVRAQTWDDDPRRVRLGAEIFATLDRAIPLRADMTVLDYGAGTGLLTLALAPRVRRVLAVDSSAGMLAVLAQKAQAGGLANVDVRLADFAKDPLPAGPFDLIASAMTLHHVADVDALFRTFFALLAPGGCLAVADLDAEDGSFHGANAAGVHHLGFAREALGRQLAAAGFAAVRFADAARSDKNGRAYPVFLATARKP
ncbi:MAG: class I SAM-dependent methyltransferase [Kiritimatiellia bacterium]